MSPIAPIQDLTPPPPRRRSRRRRARAVVESAMVTKRPQPPVSYDFLRRKSSKDAKKTPTKSFAFGERAARAPRKNPVGR